MSPAAPALETPSSPHRDTAATPDRPPRRGPAEPGLAGDLRARLSAAAVVRTDEPLAPRTTLRVGGPADVYVEPADEGDLAAVLQACRERGVPWLVLGRGSNLLVRDAGYRGVVISLSQPAFRAIRGEGAGVRAGAGARLKDVAAFARQQVLTGFEFLEGIPGSVGGALRMNAGAMGSSIFSLVQHIRSMDRNGRITERPVAEVPTEYRHCAFFIENLALEAVLHGTPGEAADIRARSDSLHRRRWETQPPQPSAGCIFRNPLALPAGKLVDELGFKGQQVGGAQVSPVHGNFIVNVGGATARDVLTLIERIRERARADRGIELATEVEIVGEDAPSPPSPA